MPSLRETLLFLTLATCSLGAGGLALVSIGLVRATSGFDAQLWPQVHRALDGTVGPWMGALLVLSILGTAAVALTARPAPLPARLLFGGAAALFALAVAVTFAVNLPINGAVRSWGPTAPADWEQVRARWATFQHLRATLAFGGLAAALLGALRLLR